MGRRKHNSDEIVSIARRLLAENATIKETAGFFGVSYSTIFINMTKRLPMIDEELAYQVSAFIAENKSPNRPSFDELEVERLQLIRKILELSNKIIKRR